KFHAQKKQVFALAEKSVRIGWTYADAFKNIRKRLNFSNRDYLFATKDRKNRALHRRSSYFPSCSRINPRRDSCRTLCFMARIKPFAALRPKPELAAQICELPYDVMSSEEARELAAGNPLSFLHVSKPEIDLPSSTDIYSPQVYVKGQENFQKLIAQ